MQQRRVSMSALVRLCSPGLLTLTLCSGALAQKAPQPWTPPWTSHISVVQSCQNPIPAPRVARDDWICWQSGNIIRIDWWGVVFVQQQLQLGRYYIAIYD